MNNYKIMIKKNIKENIIYSFKYKYVQAKRIYIKGKPCILVLKSAKTLVRKDSGSAFHCLAEK